MHVSRLAFVLGSALSAQGASPPVDVPPDVPPDVVARPGRYQQLTEPPCSYCATQDEKGLVAQGDRVVAWLRAKHQGGAIPVRHFLAAPRVINDTYGLFFYDADGGYVSAFAKDYGYEFFGWRRGVMVVRSRDGSLWSALTGVAFSGPSRGKALPRIPSLTTTWGHWLRLHPESTAYDMFDGKRYPSADLPSEPCAEARASMGEVDARLPALASVLGVRVGDDTMAFPLDGLPARACLQETVGGWSVAVFFYGPTDTAVAWRRVLDDRRLDFYADDVSPPTAPWKDRATETRWSLAGRGIDGLLRGRELQWVESVQCRWFAWVAEHPKTRLYDAAATQDAHAKK
ncbi:MAG: DUF3179 domain-containing (seleno)protein [Planctomycetota bacterium]